MKLSDMPNIGSVVQQQLIRANITTPEQLSQIGSREACVYEPLTPPPA